jgi:hypothetical protein
MTMALCFNCGETKFGALCPCPACQVSSTGNAGLDIAFTDHYYAVKTLEEFGAVIRKIQTLTEDKGRRFWTFIHYVSENHPSILKVDLEPAAKAGVMETLRGVVLPSVTLRPSRSAKMSDPKSGDDG